MPRNRMWLYLAAVLAVLPAALYGVAAPSEAPRLLPPAPPAHARRSLTTAADLAADLAEVVRYLEAGQAYFRAYGKGSHTAEENQAFLAFLETYEKEVKVAKKEVTALSQWVATGSALDARSE